MLTNRLPGLGCRVKRNMRMESMRIAAGNATGRLCGVTVDVNIVVVTITATAVVDIGIVVAAIMIS